MKYLKYLYVFVVVFASGAHSTLAQNIGGTVHNGQQLNASGGSNSSVLANPLRANNFIELLNAIIDILIVFAIPIIVLYIMYAGFKYVTARGDSGAVSDAHQALLWSVIGGVIILGAKLIVAAIAGTVNSL